MILLSVIDRNDNAFCVLPACRILSRTEIVPDLIEYDQPVFGIDDIVRFELVH